MKQQFLSHKLATLLSSSFTKKALMVLITAMTCLNMYPAVRSCNFTVEGSDPTDKKYCFEITKPEGFDACEYQYMMWKILKDRGYTMVPQSEAAVVIKMDFTNHEVLHEGFQSVYVGERWSWDLFGWPVSSPVFERRSTGHYTENIINLDIKALPAGADENSMPIWKMSMGETDHDCKYEFLYGIDHSWLCQGHQFISFKINDKKGDICITKLKFSDAKATPEQTMAFSERVQYLNSKAEAYEYNLQLNN